MSNFFVVLFLLVLLQGITVTDATDPSSRIVGGDIVTSSSKYPSFVLFEARRSEQNGATKVSVCGGTLISPNVVLTAAHCVSKTTIVSITVIFGLTDLKDDPNFTEVQAESWTPHPEYNERFTSDIGIIRLSQTVTNIDPMPLNFDPNFPVTSSQVTAVGFGYEDASGPLSDELREVTLSVRQSSECPFSDFDNAYQICAGSNRKGACSGDSGGPAVADGYLIGLTSYGSTGCNKTPTVFTRVSAYEGWVKDQVCSEESQLPSWCDANDSVDDTTPPLRLPGPVFGCFAGSTMVDIANRGAVRMDKLQLEDLVHVGQGSYEPIYSFGHLFPSTLSSFLHLTTEKSSLRLTHAHMIFEKSRGVVPASTLRVDDVLFHVSGTEDRISSIQKVEERGVYAPFTPSGRIIVNGILASSYVALQEKELELFGWTLDHQWLSHASQFPQRLLCYHTTGFCPTEQYTSDGIALSVHRPLQMATWLLRQKGGWRVILISLLALMAAMLTVLEAFVSNPTILLVVAALFMAFRTSRIHFAFSKQA